MFQVPEMWRLLNFGYMEKGTCLLEDSKSVYFEEEELNSFCYVQEWEGLSHGLNYVRHSQCIIRWEYGCN